MIIWGVGLIMVVLAVTAERATADTTPMRLSLDGRSWSSSIDRALFTGDRSLIPGDEDQVAFWVRNDSADAAHLSLEIVDVGGDLRLGTQLQLSAHVGGRTVPLNGTQPVLVVPAGGSDPAEVRLVARLSSEAGNDVKGRSLTFRLRVGLTERPTAQQGDALTESPTGSALLPGTGGPALGWLVLGSVLVLIAAGLFRWRRGISGVRR